MKLTKKHIKYINEKTIAKYEKWLESQRKLVLLPQEIKLIIWWRECSALKGKETLKSIILGLETINDLLEKEIFILSVKELEKLKEIL